MVIDFAKIILRVFGKFYGLVRSRPVTRTQQPGGAMIFLGGAITYNKFSFGQLKYQL